LRVEDSKTGRKGEEAERLLREAFELDPTDADTLCALAAVPWTPALWFRGWEPLRFRV